MKKILVTGGAGYIGSVTVKAMQNAGYDVVVFDSLEFGHKEAVTCPLIIGNLLDKESLRQLDQYQFDGVIHFAAYLQVKESMSNPYKYFQNNMLGGLNLLEYMKEKKIPFLVFSSTAAVFGLPEKNPITEDEAKQPTNVYGESKLMFEKVLSWYDKLFDIKSISLRYFNAAGAAFNGTLGEQHNPETHIIPSAISAALHGKEFTIFGNDYPTPDGTCVRDYIHVEDLAAAHIKALEYVEKAQKSDAFNLGTGNGYSNKEVVEAVKKVTGIPLSVVFGPQRPGDPAVLLADNTKAKTILGWNPERSDLETIVETAYLFHKSKTT